MRGFELFRLGEKHLEHYLFTSDTFFIEHNPDADNKFYAAASIYGHKQGPLSDAFDYTQQGGGCFLELFYIRHVLNGIAYFTAMLSGIENIDFIVLEERVNDNFTEVQHIDFIDSTLMFLESGPLHQGINDFRLKVVLAINTGKCLVADAAANTGVLRHCTPDSHGCRCCNNRHDAKS